MTKVMKGQCLLDIAVQETGSIENVLELAILNDISITDELVPEEDVNVSADLIHQKKNLQYYRARELKPASEDANSQLQEGIEFWYVEYDFVVS